MKEIIDAVWSMPAGELGRFIAMVVVGVVGINLVALAIASVIVRRRR